MGLRVNLGRALISLGNFIQSLPVMVMRPDDLVEFSRQTYARSHNVEAWSEDELVDSGLTPDEIEMAQAFNTKKGALLLLGLGGGREAIPFAKMGFQVTGVDYIPAMVENSIENAAKRGVHIEGIVQEISSLDVQEKTFDVVWISRHMYSCIPTRNRRVEMVRRIALALKPGGIFLCQFQWNPRPKSAGTGEVVRRMVALFTLGNLDYEPGDILWQNVEFVHAFSSEDTIHSELEEGGLSVVRLQTSPTSIRGWAVAKKDLANGKY